MSEANGSLDYKWSISENSEIATIDQKGFVEI